MANSSESFNLFIISLIIIIGIILAIYYGVKASKKGSGNSNHTLPPERPPIF